MNRPATRFRDRTPLLGEGLVAIPLRLAVEDVVYFKGLLEAHEGIGSFFAERGGELTVFTTTSQEGELRALLEALRGELTPLGA